nr:hypothetical protein Iba_chr06bCG12760 [Ipomoea batatas]GMD47776.1 hypothetical protein Iba_scaffold46501CG0010 [Ipomoea batatas]
MGTNGCLQAMKFLSLKLQATHKATLVSISQDPGQFSRETLCLAYHVASYLKELLIRCSLP